MGGRYPVVSCSSKRSKVDGNAAASVRFNIRTTWGQIGSSGVVWCTGDNSLYSMKRAVLERRWEGDCSSVQYIRRSLEMTTRRER